MEKLINENFMDKTFMPVTIKRVFLFSLCISIFTFGSNLWAQIEKQEDSLRSIKENEIEQSKIVQSETRQVAGAVYEKDVKTVLSFTHPKVIEALGGMAAAETTLRNTFSKMSEINMKMESFEFPADPIFIKGSVHQFALIPTKAQYSVQGQKAESLNYQFGVRALDATSWKYIEGSQVNAGNVKNLFPDFPDNIKFPEISRKKL